MKAGDSLLLPEAPVSVSRPECACIVPGVAGRVRWAAFKTQSGSTASERRNVKFVGKNPNKGGKSFKARVASHLQALNWSSSSSISTRDLKKVEDARSVNRRPLCRWPEEEEKKEAKVYNFHPDDYDGWIPDGWVTFTAV